MKTLFLALAFFILTPFIATPSFAADAYQNAMRKNLVSLQNAKTIDEYATVANTFERIASMKSDEWLPAYYCAYTNLQISNLQDKPEDKDAFLDKAQAHLDKAAGINKEDSEIMALQGFILMMKVSVDPANRGQALAGKTTAAFEKAVQLNPSNPRAQFLMGNWAYGTAQFFNSSTDEACSAILKSITLFEAEQKEGFHPQWGKDMAEGMVKYCQ